MFRNSLNLRARRVRTAAVAAAALTVSLVAGIGFLSPAAHSGSIFEPIFLDAPDTIAAGTTVQVSLGLEGGPSAVTIYSTPAGAVNYTGTVDAANATLSIPTNPDGPTGDVTLHLSTGGSVTVSDSATVEQNETTAEQNVLARPNL